MWFYMSITRNVNIQNQFIGFETIFSLLNWEQIVLSNRIFKK